MAPSWVVIQYPPPVWVPAMADTGDMGAFTVPRDLERWLSIRCPFR
jgi:hypothetical protein